MMSPVHLLGDSCKRWSMFTWQQSDTWPHPQRWSHRNPRRAPGLHGNRQAGDGDAAGATTNTAARGPLSPVTSDPAEGSERLAARRPGLPRRKVPLNEISTIRLRDL